MNISEMLPCKVYNLANLEKNVDSAIDGSFKHLYEKACKKELNILVDDNGTIIGGEYVSGKVGAEDTAAQRVFMQKYACKPLMEWLPLVIQLSMRTDIADIIETETSIALQLMNGDTEYIEGSCADNIESAEGTTVDAINTAEYRIEKGDLDVYMEQEDADEEIDPKRLEANIKQWIREETGHYIAKDCKLEYGDDPEDDWTLIVRNVKLGRKI